MEQDETQVTLMPRPSGSVRPRFVLGVTLLFVGLGDLLFMSIVLLPQVLAAESVPSARPKARATPVVEPAAPAGLEAERGVGEVSRGEPAAPVALPVAPPEPAAPVAPPVAPPEPAAPVAPPVRAAASFPPLLFLRSTAWLSPKAEEVLAKVAAMMKEDASLRVRLEGHTDESGPAQFNSELALRRAHRARKRLQDLGIQQARIDIKGLGSQQPADNESTAQARARNRRVEIVLY